MGQLIFHVAEEALLWGVVPAISSPGYGLPQFDALYQLDEFDAGVVDALVAVDNGFSY